MERKTLFGLSILLGFFFFFFFFSFFVISYTDISLFRVLDLFKQNLSIFIFIFFPIFHIISVHFFKIFLILLLVHIKQYQELERFLVY